MVDDMKAVMKSKPEPGIDILEVPTPKIKRHEVLIEVKACGICGSDVGKYLWKPGFEWLRKYIPIILGHEFSGQIVEVGADVKGVNVGDRVTCIPNMPCGRCNACLVGKPNICSRYWEHGIGVTTDGAYAKYVAVPGDYTFRIPENVSYEAAALTEPLSVSLRGVNLSSIAPGDTFVVLGPGPIGLLAVIAAKAAGASRIFMTGLEVDKERLEAAKKLGVEETINVDEQDPIKRVLELTEGSGADVVLDASGNEAATSQGIKMLRIGGEEVVIGMASHPAKIDVTDYCVRREIVLRGAFGQTPHTWKRALALLADKGKQIESLITHRFRVEQAKEAFDLLASRKGIKALIIPT